MKQYFYIFLSCLGLWSCGGGGSTAPVDTVQPNPNQTPGSYNGVPYTELSPPPGLANYPTAYFPNYTGLNAATFQIAYGYNTQIQIANLTTQVLMVKDGTRICSATPVAYVESSNTTFFVGAAHCFLTKKTNPTTVNIADMYLTSQVNVSFGVTPGSSSGTPVQAIFVMKTYCYNATFSVPGGCPNYNDTQEVAGGQGNDLAVLQVPGKYANPESYPYPQVVPASEYPQQLSMAPILSIGYGGATNQPATDTGTPKGTMFYVANYFYQYYNPTGYYYLQSSYYNPSSGSNGVTPGYGALICGGDSGGGDLFWTGSKWILLAEHTYGPFDSCGTFYTSLPNAATNVSSYYTWIESIINDTSINGVVSDCNNGVISNCVTNG